MRLIQVRKGLLLKEIESTDAADLFNTIDREREYLREWLPFVDYTSSLADSEEFIRSAEESAARETDRVFVIKFQERFVGLVGFKGTDTVNRKSEIGYWLSEAYQKKGIMTDSVSALVRYGFDELGLNRIQIKCAVGNISSKKIPQRLGFVMEGIERDGEILSDGQYTDLEIYSIVKRTDNLAPLGGACFK